MGGEPASRHTAPPRWSPNLRWRRVFPGEEHQPRVLRRWLASLLPECPARDDVTCVASELGANAIRHTASGRGGWFAAEITWYGTMVRVAVADAGAPSGPCLVDDPGSENGRGLIVVRGLSVGSGVCGDHRGRLVWADIPSLDALASSQLRHLHASRVDLLAGIPAPPAGPPAGCPAVPGPGTPSR